MPWTRFAEVRTRPRERGGFSISTAVLVLDVDPYGSGVVLCGLDVRGHATGNSRHARVEDALREARRFGIVERDWHDIPTRETDPLKMILAKVYARALEVDCVVLGGTNAGFAALLELVSHGARAALFELAEEIPAGAFREIEGLSPTRWLFDRRERAELAGAYVFPSVTLEHTRGPRHRFAIWSGAAEAVVDARFAIDASAGRAREQWARLGAGAPDGHRLSWTAERLAYGPVCVIGNGPWAGEQARVAHRETREWPTIVVEPPAHASMPSEAETILAEVRAVEPLDRELLEVTFTLAGTVVRRSFEFVVLAGEPEPHDLDADLRCGVASGIPILEHERQREDGLRAARRILDRL